MKLAYPLINPIITWEFGAVNPAISSKPHAGVDLRALVGTPTHASQYGAISPYDQGAVGYGKYIVERVGHGTLDGNDGSKMSGDIVIYYAHLSQSNAAKHVAVGDAVGRSGNTGNSTAPHLHWEVRVDNVPVNPLLYVMEHPGSLFAMHVQRAGDDVLRFVERGLPRAIKVLTDVGPGFVQKCLDKYNAAAREIPWIWVRAWADDIRDACVNRGSSGARTYFERVMPMIVPFLPFTHVTETVNEYIPDVPERMLLLNEFEVELCRLLRAEGLETIIGNFAPGWPDFPMWQYYKDALTVGTYLGKHDYGWPTNGAQGENLLYDPYRILRHRKDREWLNKLNYPCPPLVITEFGWDKHMAGDRHLGFQGAGAQRNQFVPWVQWYCQGCAQDGIRAASYFETGANPDWGTFDMVGTSEGGEIADWTRTSFQGIVAPQPPEALPTEEEIRAEAWSHLYPSGVPYNPAAAFPSYAREKGWGAPTTVECDIRGVRLQGYSGGVVWAVIGDWGNPHALAW